MSRKLILVKSPPLDIKNVVYLGDSLLSNVKFKRVKKEELTKEEKNRIVCLEVCACKHRGYCNGSSTPCTYAVLERTPQELADKQADVKRLYPLTTF